MRRCQSHYHGEQCERNAGHDGLCEAVVYNEHAGCPLDTRWNRGIEQTHDGRLLGPLPPLADECYPPDAKPIHTAAEEAAR